MRRAPGSTRRSAASLLAGLLLAALSTGPAVAQTPPAEDRAAPQAPNVPDRDIYRLRGEREARGQALWRRPREVQPYRGPGSVLGHLSSPPLERDRAALAHRLTEALREGRPQTAAPAVRRDDDPAGESAAPSERSRSQLRADPPRTIPDPAPRRSRWWLGLIPPLVILAVLAALAAFGPSPRKGRRAR